MDLHEVMSSLQQATDLDLLRLSTAIDHLLLSPSRILAVRQHLHLGQEVPFWNLHLNRMHHGRITKFKPEEVLMLTQTPAQYWWVPMRRSSWTRTKRRRHQRPSRPSALTSHAATP